MVWLIPVAFLVGSAAGAVALAWWRRRGETAPPAERASSPAAGRSPAGFESLEGVALRICESARVICGAPTAVVLHEPMVQETTVVSVSQGVDRRLIRTPVAPDSAAGRACTSDLAIVGMTGHELFGQFRAGRRRREEQGTAYPLQDNGRGVGALVIFDRDTHLPREVRARLQAMISEEGPRLAAAAAIRAAELRALTDELTGLWNRRALDQVMQGPDDELCALLLVDLDHFKRVNDTLGHTAGDAALTHVARVMRGTLREQDLAARVGGEEFGVWLPNTDREQARQVAERVRAAIAHAPVQWAGNEIPLTCSVGLATRPDTVTQVANLYAAADAALYRAKQGGRNRVEIALPSR